jgi:hypothetical protein
MNASEDCLFERALVESSSPLSPAQARMREAAVICAGARAPNSVAGWLLNVSLFLARLYGCHASGGIGETGT